MSETVVILGHPKIDRGSIANKFIMDELIGEPDIEIRNLHSLYPDSNIDGAVEQEKLLEAETVVFQFPFYWYSMPGLLKSWLDSVFIYGFAYGAEGDKLHGKNLIISTTVGGPEQSYQTGGYNTFTMEELLKPLQQTANLSGMIMQKPVISHGMAYIPNIFNTEEKIKDKAKLHAQRLLIAIRDCGNNLQYGLIRETISTVFDLYDQLAPADSFLPFLDENLKLITPEGEFQGADGFNQWYSALRETFQKPLQHKVRKLSVDQIGSNRFEARFRVELCGSSKSGQAVSNAVQESWLLEISDSQDVKILSYLVKLTD